MMKHLTRAVIFTVSILVSYLITGAIEERVFAETERFRPITATLIGMALIVCIFAPVFAYTDRLTEAAVKASLQQTKSGAGKVIGVLAFVVIVFVILFALFLDKWFNKSIIEVFNAF